MIGLHRVDANDSGLIAALRTEGLPDPGAGRYFRADDDSALAGYVGRSVLIRYDPRDITEIRVFDHEEFICKAVNQDHHGQKVSLKEIQAARNARRRALREGINERIAVVATHTSPTPPAKAPPAPRRKLKVYKEDLR